MRAAPVLLLALAIGCSPSPPTTTRKADDTSDRTARPKLPMPLADFKKLTVGKTQEEVRDLLGAPDDTVGGDGTPKTWLYYESTINPDSGKKKTAFVKFDLRDGKWVCVNVD